MAKRANATPEISGTRFAKPPPVTKRALPILLLLASCAVGPDYRRPAGPDPSSYTETDLGRRTARADTTGGAAQTLDVGASVAARWWDLFRSPDLSRLVAIAIARNPGLEAARDALRNAQELTLAQYSGLFPAVTGQVQNTAGRFPFASSDIPNQAINFSYYDAQLTLTYNFDVWGLTRRTIEQRAALADDQRFLLEATYLTLVGNVVATAINEASLRAQIAAQRTLIDADRSYLKVIENQFTLGGATGTDVALQQAQLAQAEAVLIPLQTQLAQSRDALAAYLGAVPAEADLPDFTLDSLSLPPDLPLSLPADLIAQRPDIRQADANLHAATAAIGIAIANRLPQVTINAQIGSVALQAGQLFSPGNGLATLLSSILQPIFEGGNLLHQQRAAVATARQQAALWRQTVIGAFQNVADVLQALQGDSRLLAADLDAERAAAKGLSLAQLQYRLGGASYITVLTAEITDQTAIIALARAQAARFADSAALFVALGGGWWNRDDLPPPPPGVLKSLLP
jgi:NodT family efflux transporter outer membrane factor (OMF) lipoprotein